MADASQLATTLLGLQPRKINPLSQQYKYGSNLMEQGSSTAPVRSPLEGIARALQGALGGWVAHDANEQQKTQDQSGLDALTGALGAKDQAGMTNALKGYKGDVDIVAPLLVQLVGQKQQQFGLADAASRLGTGAPATATPPQQAPGGAASAIGGIESGGQPNGGYGAVGPVANSQGNRAYGKYQVLDSNIGPWTQEVLGKAMSPQEFLANPDAQNKVFETKFGQYTTQYGSPQAASKAWFAGPNGMSNPGASDVNGMTVAKYGDNFDKAMGGQPQPGGAVAPAVPNVPRPQPSPDILARVKQDLASGAYGTGPEAMAKANAALNAEVDKQWGVDRENAKMGFEQKQGDYTAQRNIALQGAERDRQQNTATPNAEQSLSSGFADRMTNSAGLINKFASAGTDMGARAKEMLPFGIGNMGQTPEYQQYKQAQDDFINAQLRRESGAAIAPSEYSNAARQYFPQPGDGPEVLAQKAKNRQLAVEGMVRNAGPAYQQSPTVGMPIQPTAPTQPGGGGQVSGVPKPGTVEQGYRFKGGNPADKSSWEPVQ